MGSYCDEFDIWTNDLCIMLLSVVLKMEVGTPVIYYSKVQRDFAKTDEELFEQNTFLGTIQSVLEDSYVIKPNGFSLTAELVSKKYVRAARQEEWYEFWKKKGYWKSGWFYALFVIFFLLFVK